MYKALITAGPTHEFIDPVRYITNNASGKQGYAIADYLFSQGFDVNLISGPVNLSSDSSYNIIKVKTCDQMLRACESVLPVDVAIFTAAVTDWCPIYHPSKIKKNEISAIELNYNVDIVRYISTHRSLRPKLVIGFALESENILENARSKLISKECDWIIANHVSLSGDSVMGNDCNQITIITRDSTEELPLMTKVGIAKVLGIRINEYLSNF